MSRKPGLKELTSCLDRKHLSRKPPVTSDTRPSTTRREKILTPVVEGLDAVDANPPRNCHYGPTSVHVPEHTNDEEGEHKHEGCVIGRTCRGQQEGGLPVLGLVPAPFLGWPPYGGRCPFRELACYNATSPRPLWCFHSAKSYDQKHLCLDRHDKHNSHALYFGNWTPRAEVTVLGDHSPRPPNRSGALAQSLASVTYFREQARPQRNRRRDRPRQTSLSKGKWSLRWRNT